MGLRLDGSGRGPQRGVGLRVERWAGPEEGGRVSIWGRGAGWDPGEGASVLKDREDLGCRRFLSE